MSRTRSQELRCAGRLLELLGQKCDLQLLPHGTGPDVMVSDGARRFGIEVTQYFRAPAQGRRPRREMEGVRDKLLRRARDLWRSEVGLPVEVHCHFDLNRLPKRAEAERAARQLVDAVRSALPDEGGYQVLRRQWHRDDPLPEMVTQVSILASATLTDMHWGAPDGDWVPDLRPHDLDATLAVKSAQIERYRTAFNEIWLLIVLDGHRMSGTFTLTAEVREAVYDSPFDRVYLLETFRAEVVRLKLRAPGAGST